MKTQRTKYYSTTVGLPEVKLLYYAERPDGKQFVCVQDGTWVMTDWRASDALPHPTRDVVRTVGHCPQPDASV